MAGKKRRVEPLSKDMPVYTIGVASQLLDVHPRTLRIYEEEELIKPHRQGTRRLYSQNDLQWITCLRSMIHDQGISIPGIRKLLRYAPCYEIAECPDEVHCNCDAVVDKVIPKRLRLAGDEKNDRLVASEERRIREDDRRGKSAGDKDAGEQE
jgi:MerR family transcriptional regulator/heat shock protein HspR